MKEYLPSRQFIIRVGIIALIALATLGIYKIISLIKFKKEQSKEPTKLLIKDVVQKDTNSNGIPDWEESLWGLDPNKDGQKNKEIITEKRAELAKSSNDYIIDGNQPSKDTEDLSKEFFATIVSLQQTGNLDDSSMDAISKAVGEKIVAEPISDIYTPGMMTTKPTNEKTTSAYLAAFKKLNDKYADKDMGNELIFIAQGIKNNDPQAISVISDIATSYRSFGRELVKIPVPDSVSTYNLMLANDYEKVAQSIDSLTLLLSDPIIGMKGLINYKKYSDELISNIQNISDNIQ